MSGERPPNWDFYAEPRVGEQGADEWFSSRQVPPKIIGYRRLTEAEIAIINRIKAKAEEVRELLAEVQGHDVTYTVDPRWLAIGQTDLQTGFMAVIRAVARPETF